MSLGASLMNVFVAILWQVLCYVFFKEAEVSWEIELDKQKLPAYLSHGKKPVFHLQKPSSSMGLKLK